MSAPTKGPDTEGTLAPHLMSFDAFVRSRCPKPTPAQIEAECRRLARAFGKRPPGPPDYEPPRREDVAPLIPPRDAAWAFLLTPPPPKESASATPAETAPMK